MKKEFRTRILTVADRGLEIMEEYFAGTRHGTDKVAEATKMISMGVKVEHMNQMKEQGDKSLALRVIKYLPRDAEVREKYVRMTNPELSNLLLPRPEKKRKKGD